MSQSFIIENHIRGKAKKAKNFLVCSLRYNVPPEVFREAKNARNLFAAGAPTRTPLGEVTTLLQTPSRLLERGILSPHSSPTRRRRPTGL